MSATSEQRDWRAGIPSPAALEANEAHGGLWLVRDPVHPGRPQLCRLAFAAWEDFEPSSTRLGWQPAEACIQNGRCFFQPLSRTRWGERSSYTPVDLEVLPVPWIERVHAGGGS